MEVAMFEIEKSFIRSGYDVIIGTDEVGRGPLAGPVVACAVALRNFEILNPKPGVDPSGQIFDDKNWELVRDSKKLSEKQREKMYDFICQQFHVGIGLCSHETIDRINILEASFLAMKKAVQELLRKMTNDQFQVKGQYQAPNHKLHGKNAKYLILVDGNKVIPNFSYDQQAIVGGDRLAKSISAASIVAKVTRDRMMRDFAKQFPAYGFEKHMGYGTKLHMDALNAQGPCKIHRKSFAPVKKAIRNSA